MSESKCDIIEEVITSNKERDVQLLSLTTTIGGRAVERFSCRYKGVLLPLVKDLDTAEVLYWYLTGKSDLSEHVVLFPSDKERRNENA